MTNEQIADRLAAFAVLLELAEANPYSIRAYRRAAELVRTTPAPVADLVRAGRVRELRGIGPAIEAKLRELVTTGRSPSSTSWSERSRRRSPGSAATSASALDERSTSPRALDLRSAEEFRRAIEDGRVREAPGVGPKTLARLEAALARPPAERRRSLAPEPGDRAARTYRRRRRRHRRRRRPAPVDAPAHLVVVATADRLERALDRFAAAPDVVAVVEQDARRAVGVTTDGLPVELVVAEPGRAGTELLRATGAPAYVAALEPLPDAATEEAVYEALGIPFCPPELREQPFRGEPPALLELADIRGDLHCHTTWSDGRASVLELGEAARALGYEYVAVCDHTPNVRVVPGVTADDLRRQGEEIAAANEELAPFQILRGAECDILPDGSLDLPDDILGELDWVTASLHAGQRTPGPELTRRVTEAMRHPAVRALSHPTGRLINHRPPNALDLEETIAVARETGVALEVNGLPDRLDLCDEHVRRAVEAGAKIVVNTDAHSTRGLGNMELAVATARRGWATAADVVNTRPLDELLRRP